MSDQTEREHRHKWHFNPNMDNETRGPTRVGFVCDDCHEQMMLSRAEAILAKGKYDEDGESGPWEARVGCTSGGSEMSDQTDPQCECEHVASAHEHGKRCAGKHFVAAGNYHYACLCTKCPHEVKLEAAKTREEAAALPWWDAMSQGDIAAELSATLDIGLDLAGQIADWILTPPRDTQFLQSREGMNPGRAIDGGRLGAAGHSRGGGGDVSDHEWIHVATTWDKRSKITRVYIDGTRYPQFPRRLGWLAHLIWRFRRWLRGPLDGLSETAEEERT